MKKNYLNSSSEKIYKKFRSEFLRCCSTKQKEWRYNNPEKVKQNKRKFIEQNKEKETYLLKTNEKQMLNFVQSAILEI